MAGKLWRSRGRFMLSNLVLFGLGVMTCLICLQMFATSGINDPIVYTNPEEYRLALQLKQPPPLQADSNVNGNINNNNFIVNNNNNVQSSRVEQRQQPVLCGPNGVVITAAAAAGTTSRQTADLKTTNVLSSSSNLNSNMNNGVLKSSALHSNSNPSYLRSHQDELKHFEGVALPPDNNNVISPNDILNNKDTLLLQEENTDVTPPGPTVWVVTPTFHRPEQKPELTRIAQALLPVSDFVHWIVIEDVTKGTDTSFEDLKRFMQRFPLAVTILKSLPPKSRIVGKPRGVGGRTAAIQWLRENAQEGVVYFADDDNTYDSSIFKQVYNFLCSKF